MEYRVVPRRVRTVHGVQTVHYYRAVRRPLWDVFWDVLAGIWLWLDWSLNELQEKHPKAFNVLAATVVVGCIVLTGLVEGSE